jgi:hypothetical protein
MMNKQSRELAFKILREFPRQRRESNMTTTPKPEKPYGYDVEIQFHGGTIKRFSKQGSEARVRRWAMMKSLAKSVVSLKPYTREEWVRVHGDGRIRM